MMLSVYISMLWRNIRNGLLWIKMNPRRFSVILLILSIYPIGELWRLWESGYFKNYSCSWVYINPKDETHPQGIYFIEMKWNIKKVSESICWVLFALASILAVWKDKLLLLFFSEFLCYTVWDLGLMFYNHKTDFYCFNFTILAIVDFALWQLLIRHRAKNLSL